MNHFALFRDWLGYLYLVFIFLTLLGVYLVFLGIGLAGLVSALRRQERQNHPPCQSICPKK